MNLAGVEIILDLLDKIQTMKEKSDAEISRLRVIIETYDNGDAGR